MEFKTKLFISIIATLSVLLIGSCVVNFVLLKGIKISQYYTTTSTSTSTSNSYANSGSIALSILGYQNMYTNKWVLVKKQYTSEDEYDMILRSLAPWQYMLKDSNSTFRTITYPDFQDKQETKGIPTIKTNTQKSTKIQ